MAHSTSTATNNSIARLLELQKLKGAQDKEREEAAAATRPAEPPVSDELDAPSPAPAKPQNTEKPKSKSKKAPSKQSAGKKKAPVAKSDSKLRKPAPDPTAQRVGARVPKDLYEEMAVLRATQGLSMDYTITHAVHTVLRHKYGCACGCSFYMDASESAVTTPSVCPACGNNTIRKAKNNR